MTDDVLVEDRIERDIPIDAPIERVWQLVSEPGWWINAGEITEHRIEWQDDLAVVHDDANGQFTIRTIRADPPRYVSFRWELGGDGKPDDLHTLVEFFLDDRPGGVTLRVVESGFASLDLPAERHRARFDENSEGWEIELAAAQTHLQRR